MLIKMLFILRNFKSVCLHVHVLTLIAMLGFPSMVQSAQQYQGFCSYVKMEIQQQMAIERTGFLATLEVTNNEGDAVITDFASLLTFSKTIIGEDDEAITTDASDLFYVQPAILKGINSIDGRGQISPGETAVVEWFIIPKISAGGESPAGVQYKIGADLAGSIYGLEIAPEVLDVIPDTITVRPEPQLEITYFQPRDVDGDDPFTVDIVEPSVPFTLGVMVKNVGHGQANKVTIESEQPRLVEDPEGLLVVPKLLSARINDIPLSGTPSLTLNLGNITPADCRKGAWDMITTLSGEFTEFNARYTHADELGGQATSLIKSINAYFMVREVLNDQPGRDDLFDFLATTDKTQVDLIPDTLFESDCNTLPVNQLKQVTAEKNAGASATVHVTADFENWVFIRTNDPLQAKYPIESVVRSDGKVLNPRNYWTNTRYQEHTNTELNYLNIFDFVSLGEYDYIVKYSLPENDTDAPVTTLHFSGEHEIVGDTVYVSNQTQMFFLVDDVSTVGTYYRTDGGDFKPAYPFNMDLPGGYVLEYYSEDGSENREHTQSINLVVVGDYPQLSNYNGDVSEILIAGDAVSVRDTEAGFTFDASTSAASLQAVFEVYSGVYAWPTLTGIPATPTRQEAADLIVAGENVDFYRYKLNGAVWSEEFPASEALHLSDLSGNVNLVVSARNAYGNYFDDETGSLSVNWVVSNDAPIVSFTTPETPTHKIDASVEIKDVDLYRYTLDDGYYRAEAAIGTTIDLVRLNESQHTISVIGKEGGEWQEQNNASKISWLIDRNYGFELPSEKLVYQRDLGDSLGSISFNWNGHLESGAPAPYGWYTVKLILTDGLNRQSVATRLVQVGDLLPDQALLSGAGTARQSAAHGRGRWAVWQDQRNGTWNIFKKDILDSSATAVAITDLNLNQEKPHTDGEFVVWQARQADGSLDIWGKALNDTSDRFAITHSSNSNETNPVVEYPWVIFQRKSLSDVNAPWQLYAKNLVTNQEQLIDASGQDQLDPAIHGQKVVWQDMRDVGPGEVYMKDLASGHIQRITTQTAGQYHPVIEDQWIVWADNRNQQLDLYAFNLLRGVELQLTDTPEDETRPKINGQWVVYEEDSSGEQKINLRLLYLANTETVQLTNAASNKEKPVLISGNVLWTDVTEEGSEVHIGSLPNLKPVFNNQNMISVTEGMLNYKQTAGELLELWQEEAGVVEITRYNQIFPIMQSETVTWDEGVTGSNFNLGVGDLLWVKFAGAQILDFSAGSCLENDLDEGVNVLASQCLPDDYTAYGLLKNIGEDNIRAVRLLNSQTGRWQVATVNEEKIIGENFDIPPMAVLLIDMKKAVNKWLPTP